MKLDFIRPGKPTENAFIESFNGRLRDEEQRSESTSDVNVFVVLQGRDDLLMARGAHVDAHTELPALVMVPFGLVDRDAARS